MIQITSIDEMQHLAQEIGARLQGGELIELVGDVGAGKTTFVRGLARGMGITEQVQSPSFTINRVYDAADDRRLVHYDFYRLNDPGIMADELLEALNDTAAVVVIEWADAVSELLPQDRLTLRITAVGETVRNVDVYAKGKRSQEVIAGIQ